LTKKAIEITPGIEPLYGTRDENLRLLEDGLQVQIDLRSDAIYVAGEEAQVARAAQVFADFDALRKMGTTLQNGELHALLKLVVSDPKSTLKGLVETGKQRSAGVKRMVQPRSANQKKYVGYRQDLSRGRNGRFGADGEEGLADYPCASCG